MRKLWIPLAALLGLTWAFPGAGASKNDVIEIKEKMFIAQTMEIYLDAKDYLGKTIRYEGYFDSFREDSTGLTHYLVVRKGPNCCQGDMLIGFEVTNGSTWPELGAWVEATGVLVTHKASNGGNYLRLRLTSLKTLEVRGAEYVTR